MTGHEQRSPISLAAFTRNNINVLRKLNAVLFPQMTYDEKFYNESIGLDEGLGVFAYYRDVCVGAVRCRKEDDGSIYIMTFGVLAPYRRLGIGAKLLENVEEHMKKDNPSVWLHVHVQNNEAIDWYCNHGFTKDGVAHDYYRRLTPPDAVILRKVHA